MASIELRPANKDNYRALARLSSTLEPPQNRFVAHNAYSMLEAIYEPDDLWPFGVYDGDSPVGFLLLGFDPDGKAYWVVRLMVATPHQGKGYGRAAMQAAIDFLKAKPGCDAIYISFVPQNTTAKALYESLGFEDTGKIEDGEVIFRLPLTSPAQA